MNKHDEGYVLVYVTVVLLIFCLVATVILTGALRSLNAQQNAIAQMQEQYVATGEIEKYIASFESQILKKSGSTEINCSDTFEAKWDSGSSILTLTAINGATAVTYSMKLTGATVTTTESGEVISKLIVTGLTAYTYVPNPTEAGGDG